MFADVVAHRYKHCGGLSELEQRSAVAFPTSAHRFSTAAIGRRLRWFGHSVQ